VLAREASFLKHVPLVHPDGYYRQPSQWRRDARRAGDGSMNAYVTHHKQALHGRRKYSLTNMKNVHVYLTQNKQASKLAEHGSDSIYDHILVHESAIKLGSMET
jgi:hypothetical protein